MNDAELLWLSDCNLAEFCREHARALPPFKLEERAGLLLVAAGTGFPAGPSNCAFPLGSGPVDAVALLDETRRFFEPLGRGFSVYAPAHRGPELARACEAENWLKLSDAPGMVLTERIQPAAPPHGVELRAIRDVQHISDFVEVSALAYESMEMPPAVTRKLWSQPERWLWSHVHILVAYEQDQPVAAGLLLFSHGLAGVYWIGTLPEARGRGHAELIMRSLSNHAFDRGASCVVLQASSFGEPVYRRLGYREFTRYPWYLSLAKK